MLAALPDIVPPPAAEANDEPPPPPPPAAETIDAPVETTAAVPLPPPAAQVAAAATAASSSSGLSAYELERLASIERNEEILRSLGLLDGPSLTAPPPKPAAARRSRPPPPAPAPSTRTLRTRSASGSFVAASGRKAVSGGGGVAGGGAGHDGDEKDEEGAEEEEEQQQLSYVDSCVHRYLNAAAASTDSSADLGDDVGDDVGVGSATSVPHGWRSTGCFGCFQGGNKQKGLYSVDFLPGHRPLLVVAGADGYVTVYPGSSLRSPCELAPLAEWRAHKAWVGDVQFVSQPPAGATHALTAANDKTVALWDLAASAEGSQRGEPRMLSQVEVCSKAGTFTMHELGGRVLTGGKECCAITTQVTASGLSVAGSVDMRMGILKSARWRDAHTFACGGDCGDAAMVDTRAAGGGGGGKGGSGGIVRLLGVHAGGVSTVRWSPCDEHVLLTAGVDRTLRLHDMRKPRAPLAELSGHAQADIHGKTTIYAPTFTHGGRCVSTLGHGSNKVSVYSASSGERVWEGAMLDADTGEPREANKGAQLISATSAGQEVLVVGMGTRVEMYAPRF